MSEILTNTDISFPSSFMQAFYIIYSYRQFSSSTLKTLFIRKFILRKITTFTFLLIASFAQEKKLDKMHHWIPHKILYKKDYIVNFSKFYLGCPKFLQDYK